MKAEGKFRKKKRSSVSKSKKEKNKAPSLMEMCQAMLKKGVTKTTATVGGGGDAATVAVAASIESAPFTPSAIKNDEAEEPPPTPTPKHSPSQWTIGLQPPVNDPMETTAEEATVDHTVVDAVKEEEIIAWKDFFAAHGTNDLKGKHVIQDAMPFNIDTFYRKRDKHSGRDGVSLLMARRDDDHGTQEAIAVFFDRSKFTEEDAADWWMHNKVRFPYHQ